MVLLLLGLVGTANLAHSFTVIVKNHLGLSRRHIFLYLSSASEGDKGGRRSFFEGNQRPPTEEELQVMDEMIDKLGEAKPYELPNAVQRAFRVISSPQFFLRIAARQDQAADIEQKEKLAALASNLVSTLEAVVSTTEDRLDERSKEVETVVKAASEPDSGEFLVPLLPERIEAMRNELLQLDPSSLDESFLTTLDAWMNKSHQDGMDLMVQILQKCLQMYAGIAISRAREGAKSSSHDVDPAALAVFEKLLSTDAEAWQVVLKQTDASLLPQVQSIVHRDMETIVLSLDAGSMAQRVQAEYLQEMVKRIESTSQTR